MVGGAETPGLPFSVLCLALMLRRSVGEQGK